MKYTFTQKEKEYRQTTFRQIKALRDIPLHGVRAGDVGGWIEEELNLSQEGACWVERDAYVLRCAHVSGNAIVRGKSIVDFRSHIGGTARVINSVVSGINSITGTSLIVDAEIRGQCNISGISHIESSQLEGFDALGDVQVIKSYCFTRLGKLTVESGCRITQSKLLLLDASAHLAQQTELQNIEALDISVFRVLQPNTTLKNERFLGKQAIQIGAPSK